MLTTTKVPRDQLESYFDRFTKHFLKYDTTTAVDVEYLSQELGDQFEAEGTHLLGVTYDPKDNAFELELENGEHRVFKPAEIWTAEDTDGFVRAIEVVHDDGTRDVIHVKRLAPRPRE
jgi:uncharacterized protein YkuJ